MIRSVRRKFIIIAMAAIIICTSLLTIAINIMNYYQVDQEIVSMLENIADNNGQFPKQADENGLMHENDNITRPFNPFMGRKEYSPEMAYEVRYFTVNYENDGTVHTGLRNIASVDEEQALIIAEKARNTGKKTGYYGTYKYYVHNHEDGTLVVVMDCETKIAAMKSLVVSSAMIAAAGMILMVLMIAIFSKRAIRPVIESSEKQKQFITDASHELKTPLTVISANMDILEMDIGKNEWIDGTKRQVSNLRKLVGNMISLSRLEEENTVVIMEKYDLTQAVKEALEPFIAMVEFEGKKVNVNLTENLISKGDESAIRQVIQILCDNAVKYTKDNGEIWISLKKVGHKVWIEVGNECDNPVDDASLSRLFDRFYRGDAARTKDDKRSGYGIGLAIAKAAVEKNNGKIYVSQNDKNIITFRIVLVQA